MTNKLKRYWLLILPAGAIILLAVSQFFRPPSLITPPSPSPRPTPKIESKFGQLRPTAEVVYTGPQLNIPSSLPAYTTEVSDPQEVIQTLVSKLQLQPHASVPQLWMGPLYTLSYDLPTETINLYLNRPDPPTAGINQTAAINQANRFIKAAGITNAVIDQANILLLGNQREYINATPAYNVAPEKAYYAVLPYHFQINGYPTYFNNLPPAYLSVVATNTSVTKAVITPPFKAVQAASKKTLSLNESLDLIRKGEGIFINVDTRNPGSITTDDLVRINLTDSFVEYRVESATKQVNPYFRYRGTGETTSGQSINLEIIVLAVLL